MIELLCVMVIIGILASMLLPTISRVYERIKGTAEEFEAPAVAELLLSETRRYCGANPLYRFNSKSEFANKCGLAPKCRDWVMRTRTDFVPFTYLSPTNLVVLSVHIGRKHLTSYAFSKGELSMMPSEHH